EVLAMWIKMAGWMLVLGASLGWTGPLAAQISDRPLPKFLDLFQAKKKAETPPMVREDADRLGEILVELAWLADPVTFPFYLDARVQGASLELHGNVPSRAVRAHAVKLARLNSPLAIVDALKENPQLKVRPLRMAP